MNFVVQPLSWFKRRTPTEVIPSVTAFNITEFEKIDNSYCKIFVCYTDDSSYNLDGRVSKNVTYLVGGGCIENGWTVQGINSDGLSVLFKLVE